MRKRSLFVMSLGLLMMVFSPFYGSATHLNYWWLGGGAFVLLIGIYDAVMGYHLAAKGKEHSQKHGD